MDRAVACGEHSTLQKTREHPCYGEEAAHRFARMHVAIAPACHLQCHYCYRKYDCANESRPGVVSRVLTPDEALEHVAATAARMPGLRVVGVAGPGDALANPERTFPFLEALRRRFPQLTPCLSTNGLALPPFVARLAALGVAHVTVTVNSLDPAMGAAIHPWAFWKHRRRRGLEAARILLEQQLAGVEALVAAGVMVKINSVLIPGINDAHLPELNRVVSAMGVMVHNVMPLLNPPESGAWFSRNGQRAPRDHELEAVRQACAGSARLMRHCRQCRADAVGLLGEETPPLPPVSPRRILPIVPARESVFQVAVASRTGQWLDEHFGHAEAFRIYRLAPHGVEEVVVRATPRHCRGTEACGEESSPLQAIVEALRDCRAVLCERIGPDPQDALRAAGIEPVQGFARQPVAEALASLNREWRM